MTAYDDDIARAVLDVAREQTGLIAGVTVNNADRTGYEVELNGTGWSPTLHSVRLRWSVDLVELPGVDLAALGEAHDAEGVMRALGEGRRHVGDAVFARQGPRARLAASLGIDRPRILPNDTSRMTPREVDAEVPIAHVHVDPVTVELLERTDGAWQTAHGFGIDPSELRRALVASMVDLHADEHDDGRSLCGFDAQGRSVSLRDGPEGGRVQPMLPFTRSAEPSFDGGTLWHDAELPETALALLPGRAVRDAIETGTSLDARVIRQARMSDGLLVIDVDPVDAPLDTIR